MEIHSQGITVEKVVIDIGNAEMCAGMTYVALSRATKFEGVILHPMQSYARYQSIAKKVVNQIKEINQLLLMASGKERNKASVVINAITHDFNNKCVFAKKNEKFMNRAEMSQCSGEL